VLAQDGYVVVFDCSNAADEVDTLREVEPGLFLYRGPWEALAGLPKVTLWLFSYNYEYRDAFPPGTAVVYDWIDDLKVFPFDQRKLEALHARALREAHVVVAVARRLHEAALRERSDAKYAPNAVEEGRFDREPDPNPALADPAFAAIVREGKPIAGYYGALANWFDYELVRETARLRPDWSFVLIGPDHDGSYARSRLDRLGNVLDSVRAPMLRCRATCTVSTSRPYRRDRDITLDVTACCSGSCGGRHWSHADARAQPSQRGGTRPAAFASRGCRAGAGKDPAFQRRLEIRDEHLASPRADHRPSSSAWPAPPAEQAPRPGRAAASTQLPRGQANVGRYGTLSKLSRARRSCPAVYCGKSARFSARPVARSAITGLQRCRTTRATADRCGRPRGDLSVPASRPVPSPGCRSGGRGPFKVYDTQPLRSTPVPIRCPTCCAGAAGST
jgi:hypothetical protein